MLIGEGNQYRYLLLEDTRTFPVEYITQLMKSARNYSMTLVKDQDDLRQGLTIVKSISEAKRASKKPAKKTVKKTVKKTAKKAAKKTAKKAAVKKRRR